MLKKIKPFLPIILIWAFGLFVRVYRQNDLLGFYYDQGRDAKMAHDILTGNNFPAIGPTTGIQGLFLGPLWYYLITPGYLIGQGSPAVASFFIVFLESLTIPLLYFLVKRHANSTSALLAALFWSGSNYLVRSSRWFSNPSPLPFFVVALIFLLTEIFKNKKQNYWIYVAFILGISLQLEAASAVFFIPVILVLILFNVKTVRRTNLLVWVKSVLAFGFLLLPQLAFEIKNKFLVTRNFIGFLTGKVNSDTGKSWAIPTLDFLLKRLDAYFHSFFSKLDTNVTSWSTVFLVFFLVGLVWLILKKRRDTFTRVTLAWLLIPLFLLLFFVGNYGTLYDYYLTGFFPAFIILFSLILTLPPKPLNWLFPICALVFFIRGNAVYLKDYLIAGVDGPTHITLGNQLQSVDFICSQTKDKPYNLAVYVPPVIPHTYDYLFSWRNQHNLCRLSQPQPTSDLYLLYEVDPDGPARLSKWYQGFDKLPLLEKKQYGGIVVERRQHQP